MRGRWKRWVAGLLVVISVFGTAGAVLAWWKFFKPGDIFKEQLAKYV